MKVSILDVVHKWTKDGHMVWFILYWLCADICFRVFTHVLASDSPCRPLQK